MRFVKLLNPIDLDKDKRIYKAPPDRAVLLHIIEQPKLWYNRCETLALCVQILPQSAF